MSTPVTAEAFFGVFRAYNQAVGPAPVLLTILGFVALAFVLLRTRVSGWVVGGILAVLWAWGGLYHLMFLSAINPMAPLFATAFVVQAVLFFWYGTVGSRLRFEWTSDARSAVAAGLAVYALVAYPAIGLALRGAPLEVAGFGLPCPTTIFTVAMLGFLKPPFPRALFIVPMLWALISVQAKWSLRIYEDLVLAAALVAALWFAFVPFARTEPA
jgi:uncharacterized protein DUF6064